MRRQLAFAVLALAGAAAVAHVDTGRAAGSEPLSIHGTLTPPVIRFADPVSAEIEVAYDPALVDAGSIRVVPNFTPFVETSSPTVSHGQRDGLAVLRMRYSLQCLTDGCLPLKRARELNLPRLTVMGTADGRKVAAVASWPKLRIVSRLPNDAVTGQIAFRHQRVLPAPAYRVPPGALAAGLIAAAAVAVAAALALLTLGLRRRSARSRADALTALERALWFARDSATRPDPADRRRALELLAEAVEDAGDDRLAGRVRDAAWVEAPPAPSRPAELADDVEAAREPA